jgi:hypothetical protein
MAVETTEAMSPSPRLNLKAAMNPRLCRNSVYQRSEKLDGGKVLLEVALKELKAIIRTGDSRNT